MGMLKGTRWDSGTDGVTWKKSSHAKKGYWRPMMQGEWTAGGGRYLGGDKRGKCFSARRICPEGKDRKRGELGEGPRFWGGVAWYRAFC